MTQTTLDQRVQMTGETHGLSSAPVIAAISIPHGTMVFKDAATGYATNTDDAGANKFLGICHAKADNSAGASGDLDVEFYAFHNRFEHIPCVALSLDDVGKRLYATDNWSLTLVDTSASYVGTLEKFISATKGRVAPDFQADSPVA